MKKKVFLAVVAVMTALCIVGCNANPNVVAKVKDKEITQSDVDLVKKTQEWSVSVNSDNTALSDEDITEELIKQKVIILECEKLGLKVTDEEIDNKIKEDIKLIKESTDLTEQMNDYAEHMGMKDVEEYMNSDIYKETVLFVLSSEKLYVNFAENITDKSDEESRNEEYKEYMEKLIDSYNAKNY